MILLMSHYLPHLLSFVGFGFFSLRGLDVLRSFPCIHPEPGALRYAKKGKTDVDMLNLMGMSKGVGGWGLVFPMEPVAHRKWSGD